MPSRPDTQSLIGKSPQEVPLSCQRILGASSKAPTVWIGPEEAKALTKSESEACAVARAITCHLAVRAPRAHKSGHPGGVLSAFTSAYCIYRKRNPAVDQPLRMSPGHLSILAFGLQWLFGRGGDNPLLASPNTIIENFRTPQGLPGHVEAGIGDIPFGTGPLGKGVSNALGVAFGLRHQGKPGIVDVLLADGDAQEGQVIEAFRLASHLKLDNLIVHGDFNDVQLSNFPTQNVAADFAAMATAMGWQVIEVQNGNDPAQVMAALESADTFLGKGRPIFICYYTTMGYGIPLMEEAANTGSKNFHGAPLSDEEAAQALKGLPDFDELISSYESIRKAEEKRWESSTPVLTDIPLVFGPKNLKGYERTVTTEKGAARSDFGAVHLLNMMKADPRIVVLHADLAGSGGFTKVEKTFPNRVINVGVAEGNMVMMAAGMRQTGLLPVTYTFAAFGTNEARASARLIDINCGHTRCGVLNDCTHTGLSVGEDGETHQERHYLNIPFDHTQVWVPADSNQAGAMAERAMEVIAEGHESVFVFSARSGHAQILQSDGTPFYDKNYVFDGRASMLRGAGDLSDVVTILTTGIVVHEALKAIEILKEEKLSVRLLNVACIRPIDSSAIIRAALETGHLIVAEDHSSEGGLASQVADIIADFQLPCSLRRLGVNHYFPSAPASDLLIMAGLDAENIADIVRDEVRVEVRGSEDALITALYNFSHHLLRSRFDTTAQDFRAVLLEKGYLDTLREKWHKRECPRDRLPSNEQLLEALSGIL